MYMLSIGSLNEQQNLIIIWIVFITSIQLQNGNLLTDYGCFYGKDIKDMITKFNYLCNSWMILCKLGNCKEVLLLKDWNAENHSLKQLRRNIAET